MPLFVPFLAAGIRQLQYCISRLHCFPFRQGADAFCDALGVLNDF